jgi:AcrR family transcriptional regulator
MSTDEVTSKRTRSGPRREKLIAVAAELFMNHAYDAVSVKMICTHAGITGPGLYRHFENKQALLIAVLDESLQLVHGEARRIAQATPDPEEALVAMVESHIRLVLQGPPSPLIFLKSQHALPEPERRRIRREMALYAEEWISVLIPLRPDLSEPEVRLLTQSVFSMLNVTATLKTGLDPDSIVSTMQPAALHALLGRSPAPEAPTRTSSRSRPSTRNPT